MEVRKVVVAIAVFLLAHDGIGQQYRNHEDTLRPGFSASVDSDGLVKPEIAGPEDASRSMQGNHSIQLSMGFLSGYGVETEVSTSGVAGSVGGNGFIGSIAYSYWFLEDFAFGVNVGIIGSEVNTSVGGSRAFLETGSVVPVLVGLKYQPLTMRLGESVRPYVFASVGPSIATATRSRTGLSFENETYSETALSSRFGLGADVVINRLFVAGISAGYYLATDFDRPIGGQKNHSSPEFTFSVGILLGEQ